MIHWLTFCTWAFITVIISSLLGLLTTFLVARSFVVLVARSSCSLAFLKQVYK